MGETQSKSLFVEGLGKFINKWKAKLQKELQGKFEEELLSLEKLHDNEVEVYTRLAQKREELVKKREEESKWDPLTDVSSRVHFENNLIETFNKRRSEGVKIVAVFFIDIDKFKDINDTYGHLKGDFALQVMAKIISDTIRSHRTDFTERAIDGFDSGKISTGRWGGDEFAVYVELKDEQGLDLVARRLRSSIGDVYTQKNLGLDFAEPVSAAIGIAAYYLPIERSLIPAVDLVKKIIDKADQQMYKAKKDGLIHVQFIHQTGGVLKELAEQALD